MHRESRERVVKKAEGVNRRDLLLSSTCLVAASAGSAAGLSHAAHAELKEYQPGTTFPGRMGRTIGESAPAWPTPVRAKPGAPNVLFIVLDDTGFGQLGCYGSPINTPNLDKLAQNGLLYTNMHTTALCSPSRSRMLTGRNHHSNGMACITEGSEGYPGSDGAIQQGQQIALRAQLCRRAGIPRRIERARARRQSKAALRVRANRQTRYRKG
jgi:arylsulfatase